MAETDNVRVALRIRPLVASEIERGCVGAVSRRPGQPQVQTSRGESFTFNYVFDETNDQTELYEVAVREMLDKTLFHGFNATILAYGQTGSGKTHTMGTAFSGQLDASAGVIPRATHDIFARIDNLSGQYDFQVSCSFLELYQEQLYDLLSNASRSQTQVDIREDKNGIFIPGLTEEIVSSATETTNCLIRGSERRAVGATAMNLQSSRSHAIFTINLRATKKDDSGSSTTAKFHLVDLAGSERSKKTQATGDRFKEGVKINQGLLVLGNVISQLGASQGNCFVPYRDSKLTRLLRDSLGGNSVTLMIACVSPADYNLEETLSTLRYADNARKIKNTPVVNQDPHRAETNRLKALIRELVQALDKTGSLNGELASKVKLLGLGSCNGETTSAATALAATTTVELSPTTRANNDVRHLLLQEKYHQLQMQLQEALLDLAENELRALNAEALQEQIKAKVDDMKECTGTLQTCLGLATEETRETLDLEVKRLGECVEEVARLLQHAQTNHNGDHIDGLAASGTDGSVDNDAASLENISSMEIHELMGEQSDAHTTKQVDLSEQIKRVTSELNIKKELHQRCIENFNKNFDKVEDQITIYESKIQELEAERSDLLDKLRHVNDQASSKLAEDRRQRVQQLEQQIKAIKKENSRQAHLLRQRDIEKQRIERMNQEIRQMKENKVRLVRTMRQESENFRQWKQIKEKELIQLRSKDRKLQNEMARKEMLETKQRNVLKRRLEESTAVVKRLRDELDRQRVAQGQRHKVVGDQTTTLESGPQEQIEQKVDVAKLVEQERLLQEREAEMQKLREEFEAYKRKHESAQLEGASQGGPKRKISKTEQNKKSSVKIELLDSTIEETDEDNFHDEDDPDWVKTPAASRRRKKSSTASRRNAANSSGEIASATADETFVTAASIPVASTKSKSCRCNANCSSKRCGCLNAGFKCSFRCQCGSSCNNKANVNDNNHNKENNTDASLETTVSTTFIVPAVKELSTPEAANHTKSRFDRLSTLPFNTPTAKKRFFE